MIEPRIVEQELECVGRKRDPDALASARRFLALQGERGQRKKGDQNGDSASKGARNGIRDLQVGVLGLEFDS